MAQENEQLAVRLHSHIEWYTPTSWRERIGVVDYAPYVLPNEAASLLELHQTGTLTVDAIRTVSASFAKWYFVEAILDFFAKGKADEQG